MENEKKLSKRCLLMVNNAAEHNIKLVNDYNFIT